MLAVGAGLAGLRACETLRQLGFEGRLKLLGSETRLPYDRPPLSKQVLSGSWEPERCELKSSESLGGLGIELELGSTAVSLDLAARAVDLERRAQGHVRWARHRHWGELRPLPGISGRPGVVSLRTLDDSWPSGRYLASGRPSGHRGCGFHRPRSGRHRTGPRCQRSLSSSLSASRSNAPSARSSVVGVRLCTGVTGWTFDWLPRSKRSKPAPPDGSGVRCHLSDGTSIEADTLLVAIGVSPATSWLEGSGLEINHGGRRL